MLVEVLMSCALAQVVQPEIPIDAPRDMTEAERAWVIEHPITVPEAVTAPPTGPVVCPGEYEPMDGIMIAWTGPSSWLAILRQMGTFITTDGNANLYVVVPNSNAQTSAFNSLQAGGADMNRVRFMIKSLNTIWCRDYGPRYIYQGDCRAIVDHTYNRPRPADNGVPAAFSDFMNHALYELPLVHGGGNYHLSSTGQSFSTRLIANENPSLSDEEIQDIWADYQNVDTLLTQPFPTSVDATQHIDMWMQVFGDNDVMISDWPFNSGSTQDNICDSTAALLEFAGWNVHRIPARLVGGTHYTYTNVVVCNDVIIVPQYTNSQVTQHNSEALDAWASAAPDKVIRSVNCQAIVTSAGVMHCICMHVPAPLGGEIPTAYILDMDDAPTFDPGDIVNVRWISDDDEGTTFADVLLSTDGGSTFDPIVTNTIDDGTEAWFVPDVATSQAVLRVLVRDAEGNSGYDDTEAFTINGTACAADITGDTILDIFDVLGFLALFEDGDASADWNGDTILDIFDVLGYVGDFEAGC